MTSLLIVRGSQLKPCTHVPIAELGTWHSWKPMTSSLDLQARSLHITKHADYTLLHVDKVLIQT